MNVVVYVTKVERAGELELPELPRRGGLLIDPRTPDAPGRLVVIRSQRAEESGVVTAVYVPTDEEDFAALGSDPG